MKIYTRRGDDGTTGLFGGARTGKDDPRVASYGDVDELNSLLGLSRAELVGDASMTDLLARLQGELLALGAQLATPDPAAAPRSVPEIRQDDVDRMEHEIDTFDAELQPLRRFILPGGTRAAATLHVARSVCRRAERAVVALGRGAQVPALAVPYLNRLADLLFTMARVANRRAGVAEREWTATKP